MRELTPYEKLPKKGVIKITKETAHYLANKGRGDFDTVVGTHARIVHKRHWSLLFNIYYIEFINFSDIGWSWKHSILPWPPVRVIYVI